MSVAIDVSPDGVYRSADDSSRVLGISGCTYETQRETGELVIRVVPNVKVVKERIARMDDILAELGRDKAQVRYSYQMFDPASRASGGAITYYQSAEAFIEKAEALIEAGMSELGLYYPLVDAQRPVFEEIGNEILPALKKKYPRS